MENIDKTFEHYEKIRESISGLAEILKINFNEKNIYYQMGMDNLRALHDNIIEVMKGSHAPREIRIKMREIEAEEQETNNPFLF